MKKLLVTFFLLIPFFGSAQLLKPAKWTVSSSKASVKAGEIVDLIFSAKLDPNWYLYSSELKVKGPMATSVEFENNGTFSLLGSLKAINPKEKYDSIWEGTINYFTGEARFVQKVKVLKPGSMVKGKLKYQTCTDKDNRCIPGKESFNLSI